MEAKYKAALAIIDAMTDIIDENNLLNNETASQLGVRAMEHSLKEGPEVMLEVGNVLLEIAGRQ